MFDRDQEAIEQYAWDSPAHLTDIMLFVRLTVNRHFYAVPTLMEKVRKHGVSAIPDRMGKRAYYAFYPLAQELYTRRFDIPPMGIFRACLTLPGIGMVKAGFIVQLLTGECGCLDRHNMERFGVKKHAFNMQGSWATIEKRIALYWCLCDYYGSAYLWDSWCDYIARLYPTVFHDAEAVSRLHVTTIIGE